MSLLLLGRDPDAEAEALREHHAGTRQAWRGTPIEPGYDVHQIQERPAMVTACLPTIAAIQPEHLQVLLEMRLCLAAAYFQPQGTEES